MKRLKFVWGTLLCQIGAAVLLVCIFSMEVNSDVLGSVDSLRNEVGMFNLARELEDAVAKDRLQNWLGVGIALALMAAGSWLIYLSDDSA